MILKELFGRSGHLSSRILLGAAAFWDVSQSEADKAIELAFSYGVNHIDVAASYGDAELRVGDWIGRHGAPSFLATKTWERTYSKAREEIQRSLDRLQVDHVDCCSCTTWLIHRNGSWHWDLAVRWKLPSAPRRKV